MSSVSDVDSNSNINVDRIHCINSLYSDSDTVNDHIHSAFHLSSDMKDAHKLNSDSHIACFQTADSLLTGFDCFELTFDLIVLTFQVFFAMKMQIMSAVAASHFLKSAVKTDKLIDTDKN